MSTPALADAQAKNRCGTKTAILSIHYCVFRFRSKRGLITKSTRSPLGRKANIDRPGTGADYQAWIADQTAEKPENNSPEIASHTAMVHRLKAASTMLQLVELCEQDLTVNPKIKSLVKRLQTELQAAVVSDLDGLSLPRNIPTVAPELWAKRIDKKENPIEFFDRVYAAYDGLTKPDMRRLDFGWYRGFHNWKTGKSSDLLEAFNKRLPDKHAVIDAQLKGAGFLGDETPQPVRQSMKLFWTARARQRRGPKIP